MRSKNCVLFLFLFCVWVAQKPGFVSGSGINLVNAIVDPPPSYEGAVKKFKSLRYSEALKDLNNLLSQDPRNEEVILLKSKIQASLCNLSEAISDLKTLRRNSSVDEAIERYKKAQAASEKVDDLLSKNKVGLAFIEISKVVDVCSRSKDAHIKRGEISLKLKNHAVALRDFGIALRISNDEEIVMRVLNILLSLGEYKRALTICKNFLQSDPENTVIIKKINDIKVITDRLDHLNVLESGKSYQRIIEVLDKSLKADEEILNRNNLVHTRLKFLYYKCNAYNELNKHKEVIEFCTNLIDQAKENSDIVSYSGMSLETAYHNKANSYLMLTEYDSAKSVAEQGIKEFPNSESLNALLKRIIKEELVSPEDDYYKLLGVAKTATKAEIRSAYYKLARQWHPDNHKEGPDKERAMDKMSKINHAKEVLLDDEERRKYDLGEADSNFMNNMYNRNNYFYNEYTGYSRPKTQRKIIFQKSRGGGNDYFIRMDNQRVPPFVGAIFEDFFVGF